MEVSQRVFLSSLAPAGGPLLETLVTGFCTCDRILYMYLCIEKTLKNQNDEHQPIFYF